MAARRHDFMIFHREIAKNHSFTATESEIPPPNVRIIENERRRFPQFPSSIKNKKKTGTYSLFKGLYMPVFSIITEALTVKL